MLARLEPDHFGGGNDHFLAGSRIATDTGLARANVEDTEPTQFDSLALLHRALHGLENCLDSDFGSRLAQACAIDYFVYDVLLYHAVVFKGWPPRHEVCRGAEKVSRSDYWWQLFRLVVQS